MGAQIVIVGGGFGGLKAAFTLRGLAGREDGITLVDREERHSFIPSIHEVSSGKITGRSLQIPLETMLAPADIRFVRDEVLEIDPANRRVTTADGPLDYDWLVVATGAENDFFGVPGAKERALRFRTPHDAVRIHAEIALLFGEEQKDVHVVLAGGGSEGVEVAGEILDLIREKGLAKDLARKRITVSLVEARPQLLPGFPPGARAFAENFLQERGVTVITGQRITAVRENSVVLSSGAELPRSLLVWTGGIRPSRLIEGLALPKDPSGWILVTDRLHSPADDRLFAVGDVATIRGPGGPLALQRLATHARDQAVVAAGNISRLLRGREPERYEPNETPRLVSIGGDMGISARGSSFTTGRWVVGLKKGVERAYLMSCLTRSGLLGISRSIPGAGLLRRLGVLATIPICASGGEPSFGQLGRGSNKWPIVQF